MSDSNIILLKIKINNEEAIPAIELTDASIQKLYQSFKYGQQEVNGFETQISRGFNNAREILGGVRETYQAITSLFQKPIQARVELEQAQVSFKILLGSAEKADSRIKELYDFTARTPFQLNEVISASRQLEVLTNGALSTGDGLRMVGDVASGVGVPIGELSMWFGRLYDGIQSGRPVGEALMRLQELGVMSGDVRGKIEDLSKSGANSAEVWNVVTEAMGRFGGMMDEQSATLGGKLSNLEDNFTQLQTSIGGTLAVGLSPFLEHINSVTASLNKNHPELIGFIGAVSTMGIAVGILNTTGIMPLIFNTGTLRTAIGTARVQLHLANMAGYATAGGFRAASIAAKGLWSSLGPVGWAVLGLTALVEVVALFGDETDDLAESMSHTEMELRVQQKEFNQLTDKINDGNLSLSNRKKALTELQEKYPGYLTNIDLEKISHQELAEAIKKGNNEFERGIRIKVYEEKYTEALKNQIKLEDELTKRLKEGNSTWDSFIDGITGKPFGSLGSDLDEITNKLTEAQKETQNWQDKIEGTKKAKGSFLSPEDLADLQKEKDVIDKSIISQVDNLVAAKETLRKIESGALKPKEGLAIDAIKKQRTEIELIENSINSSREYQSELNAKINIQEKQKTDVAKENSTIQSEINRLIAEENRLREEYGQLPSSEKANAKEQYERDLAEITKKKKSLELDVKVNIKQPKTGLLNEIDNKIKELNENISSAKTIDEIVKIEKEVDKLTKEKKVIEFKVDLQKGGGAIDVKDLKPKGIKNKGLREATKDEAEELNNIRLDTLEDGYDKELEILNLAHSRDLAKYENVVGAKEIIDEHYRKNKEKLDKASTEAQIQGTIDALNFIATAVAEHTVAGKAIAVANATWNTYKAANNALAEIPPPFNIVMAGLVTAAGLANVAKIVGITAEPPKKFEHGGRFKKGEAGYIEGYHNEIIAPEKTFLEVFERELKPQIYSNIVSNNISSGSVNNNSLLLSKFDELNNTMKLYYENPVAPVIGKEAVGKIYRDGRKISKGYRG